MTDSEELAAALYLLVIARRSGDEELFNSVLETAGHAIDMHPIKPRLTVFAHRIAEAMGHKLETDIVIHCPADPNSVH